MRRPREEGYLFWIAWLRPPDGDPLLTAPTPTAPFRPDRCSADLRHVHARWSTSQPQMEFLLNLTPLLTSRACGALQRGALPALPSMAASARRRADEQARPDRRPDRSRWWSSRCRASGCCCSCGLRFGGPVPLKPKGYRVKVAFPEATQLARAGRRADRRRVRSASRDKKHRAKHANRTLATRRARAASSRPIANDARAILRQKTLWARPTWSSTPGIAQARPGVPDGGGSRRRAVAQTGRARRDLPGLRPADAPGVPHLAAATGARRSTAAARTSTTRSATSRRSPRTPTTCSTVLDNQQRAVRLGSSATRGRVFDAISRNRGPLTTLVTTPAALRRRSAQRRALADDASRSSRPSSTSPRRTFARLQTFSHGHRPADPGPAPGGPRPQADAPRRQRALAPDLRAFRQPRPADHRVEDRLPALRRHAQGRRPALGQLAAVPRAAQPDPRVPPEHQHGDRRFRQPGIAGAQRRAQTSTPGSPGHFLRQFSPSGPESVTVYRDRLPTNRGNTYYGPLVLSEPPEQLGRFLDPPEWDCLNTGAPGDGTVDPKEGGSSAAAGCWVQGNLPFQGHATHFPFIKPDSYGR